MFEEQQPVEVGEGQPQKFVSTVIKRDPSLKNDMLANEHDRLVGNAILERLTETFGDGASAIPKITPGNASEDGKEDYCSYTCTLLYIPTLTRYIFL